MGMSKDLKKTKQIDTTLKQQGQVRIMAGSLPFEEGELDYVINEITSNMSEQDYNNGFVTRQLPREKEKKYYFYDLIYNEDGNHFIMKYEGNEDELYDR